MEPTKLTARLREVVRPPGTSPRPATARPAVVSPAESGPRLDRLARMLGAVEDGEILVVEREFAAPAAHGTATNQQYAAASRAYAPVLSRLAALTSRRPDERQGSLDLSLEGDWRGRILFFDLETTGLSGGAGTCAFLVGCGWFEADTFRTRQFFLPGYRAEPALLRALVPDLGAAGGVVTFNGRTFDLPLIEMRYLFHRMRSPFAAVAHLDLLHPARRLWRRRAPAISATGEIAPAGAAAFVAPATTPSCALTALEDVILGVTRRGDVPGWEIPGRYFAYVRSGDPRPLLPVLEHNRLDLLSLAALTATVGSRIEGGAARTADPRECFALGRLYERLEEPTRAAECYRDAAEHGDPITRAEALHWLAYRLRRERRYEEAAAAWGRVLDLSGAPCWIEHEAVEALAIYHEHRSHDLWTARSFAIRTLEQAGAAAEEKARHRLARLERKLTRPQISLPPVQPSPNR